jgi:hypothetical protein
VVPELAKEVLAFVPGMQDGQNQKVVDTVVVLLRLLTGEPRAAIDLLGLHFTEAEEAGVSSVAHHVETLVSACIDPASPLRQLLEHPNMEFRIPLALELVPVIVSALPIGSPRQRVTLGHAFRALCGDVEAGAQLLGQLGPAEDGTAGGIEGLELPLEAVSNMQQLLLLMCSPDGAFQKLVNAKVANVSTATKLSADEQKALLLECGRMIITDVVPDSVLRDALAKLPGGEELLAGSQGSTKELMSKALKTFVQLLEGDMEVLPEVLELVLGKFVSSEQKELIMQLCRWAVSAENPAEAIADMFAGRCEESLLSKLANGVLPPIANAAAKELLGDDDAKLVKDAADLGVEVHHIARAKMDGSMSGEAALVALLECAEAGAGGKIAIKPGDKQALMQLVRALQGNKDAMGGLLGSVLQRMKLVDDATAKQMGQQLGTVLSFVTAPDSPFKLIADVMKTHKKDEATEVLVPDRSSTSSEADQANNDIGGVAGGAGPKYRGATDQLSLTLQQVSLARDIPPGSAGREAFEGTFKQEVAKVLGIEQDDAEEEIKVLRIVGSSTGGAADADGADQYVTLTFTFVCPGNCLGATDIGAERVSRRLRDFEAHVQAKTLAQGPLLSRIDWTNGVGAGIGAAHAHAEAVTSGASASGLSSEAKSAAEAMGMTLSMQSAREACELLRLRVQQLSVSTKDDGSSKRRLLVNELVESAIAIIPVNPEQQRMLLTIMRTVMGGGGPQSSAMLVDVLFGVDVRRYAKAASLATVVLQCCSAQEVSEFKDAVSELVALTGQSGRKGSMAWMLFEGAGGVLSSSQDFLFSKFCKRLFKLKMASALGAFAGSNRTQDVLVLDHSDNTRDSDAIRETGVGIRAALDNYNSDSSDDETGFELEGIDEETGYATRLNSAGQQVPMSVDDQFDMLPRESMEFLLAELVKGDQSALQGFVSLVVDNIYAVQEVEAKELIETAKRNAMSAEEQGKAQLESEELTGTLAARVQNVLQLIGVIGIIVHQTANADAAAGVSGVSTKDLPAKLMHAVPPAIYRHMGLLSKTVGIPRRYIALTLAIMRGNSTAVSAMLLQELTNRSIQLMASKLPLSDKRVRMASALAEATLAPSYASINELLSKLDLPIRLQTKMNRGIASLPEHAQRLLTGLLLLCGARTPLNVANGVTALAEIARGKPSQASGACRSPSAFVPSASARRASFVAAADNGPLNLSAVWSAEMCKFIEDPANIAIAEFLTHLEDPLYVEELIQALAMTMSTRLEAQVGMFTSKALRVSVRSTLNTMRSKLHARARATQREAKQLSIVPASTSPAMRRANTDFASAELHVSSMLLEMMAGETKPLVQLVTLAIFGGNVGTESADEVETEKELKVVHALSLVAMMSTGTLMKQRPGGGYNDLDNDLDGWMAKIVDDGVPVLVQLMTNNNIANKVGSLGSLVDGLGASGVQLVLEVIRKGEVAIKEAMVTEATSLLLQRLQVLLVRVYDDEGGRAGTSKTPALVDVIEACRLGIRRDWAAMPPLLLRLIPDMRNKGALAENAAAAASEVATALLLLCSAKQAAEVRHSVEAFAAAMKTVLAVTKGKQAGPPQPSSGGPMRDNYVEGSTDCAQASAALQQGVEGLAALVLDGKALFQLSRFVMQMKDQAKSHAHARTLVLGGDGIDGVIGAAFAALNRKNITMPLLQEYLERNWLARKLVRLAGGDFTVAAELVEVGLGPLLPEKAKETASSVLEGLSMLMCQISNPALQLIGAGTRLSMAQIASTLDSWTLKINGEDAEEGIDFNKLQVGSPERQQFTELFQSEMATELCVHPNRVQINDIQPGSDVSVVVSFEISIDESSAVSRTAANEKLKDLLLTNKLGSAKPSNDVGGLFCRLDPTYVVTPPMDLVQRLRAEEERFKRMGKEHIAAGVAGAADEGAGVLAAAAGGLSLAPIALQAVNKYAAVLQRVYGEGENAYEQMADIARMVFNREADALPWLAAQLGISDAVLATLEGQNSAMVQQATDKVDEVLVFKSRSLMSADLLWRFVAAPGEVVILQVLQQLVGGLENFETDNQVRKFAKLVSEARKLRLARWESLRPHPDESPREQRRRQLAEMMSELSVLAVPLGLGELVDTPCEAGKTDGLPLPLLLLRLAAGESELVEAILRPMFGTEVLKEHRRQVEALISLVKIGLPFASDVSANGVSAVQEFLYSRNRGEGALVEVLASRLGVPVRHLRMVLSVMDSATYAVRTSEVSTGEMPSAFNREAIKALVKASTLYALEHLQTLIMRSLNRFTAALAIPPAYCTLFCALVQNDVGTAKRALTTAVAVPAMRQLLKVMPIPIADPAKAKFLVEQVETVVKSARAIYMRDWAAVGNLVGGALTKAGDDASKQGGLGGLLVQTLIGLLHFTSANSTADMAVALRSLAVIAIEAKVQGWEEMETLLLDKRGKLQAFARLLNEVRRVVRHASNAGQLVLNPAVEAVSLLLKAGVSPPHVPAGSIKGLLLEAITGVVSKSKALIHRFVHAILTRMSSSAGEWTQVQKKFPQVGVDELSALFVDAAMMLSSMASGNLGRRVKQVRILRYDGKTSKDSRSDEAVEQEAAAFYGPHDVLKAGHTVQQGRTAGKPAAHQLDTIAQQHTVNDDEMMLDVRVTGDEAVDTTGAQQAGQATHEIEDVDLFSGLLEQLQRVMRRTTATAAAAGTSARSAASSMLGDTLDAEAEAQAKKLGDELSAKMAKARVRITRRAIKAALKYVPLPSSAARQEQAERGLLCIAETLAQGKLDSIQVSVGARTHTIGLDEAARMLRKIAQRKLAASDLKRITAQLLTKLVPLVCHTAGLGSGVSVAPGTASIALEEALVQRVTDVSLKLAKVVLGASNSEVGAQELAEVANMLGVPEQATQAFGCVAMLCSLRGTRADGVARMVPLVKEFMSCARTVAKGQKSMLEQHTQKEKSKPSPVFMRSMQRWDAFVVRLEKLEAAEEQWPGHGLDAYLQLLEMLFKQKKQSRELGHTLTITDAREIAEVVLSRYERESEMLALKAAEQGMELAEKRVAFEKHEAACKVLECWKDLIREAGGLGNTLLGVLVVNPEMVTNMLAYCFEAATPVGAATGHDSIDASADGSIVDDSELRQNAQLQLERDQLVLRAAVSLCVSAGGRAELNSMQAIDFGLLALCELLGLVAQDSEQRIKDAALVGIRFALRVSAGDSASVMSRLASVVAMQTKDRMMATIERALGLEGEVQLVQELCLILEPFLWSSKAAAAMAAASEGARSQTAVAASANLDAVTDAAERVSSLLGLPAHHVELVLASVRCDRPSIVRIVSAQLSRQTRLQTARLLEEGAAAVAKLLHVKPEFVGLLVQLMRGGDFSSLSASGFKEIGGLVCNMVVSGVVEHVGTMLLPHVANVRAKLPAPMGQTMGAVGSGASGEVDVDCVEALTALVKLRHGHPKHAVPVLFKALCSTGVFSQAHYQLLEALAEVAYAKSPSEFEAAIESTVDAAEAATGVDTDAILTTAQRQKRWARFAIRIANPNNLRRLSAVCAMLKQEAKGGELVNTPVDEATELAAYNKVQRARQLLVQHLQLVIGSAEGEEVEGVLFDVAAGEPGACQRLLDIVLDMATDATADAAGDAASKAVPQLSPEAITRFRHVVATVSTLAYGERSHRSKVLPKAFARSKELVGQLQQSKWSAQHRAKVASAVIKTTLPPLLHVLGYGSNGQRSLPGGMQTGEMVKVMEEVARVVLGGDDDMALVLASRLLRRIGVDAGGLGDWEEAQITSVRRTQTDDDWLAGMKPEDLAGHHDTYDIAVEGKQVAENVRRWRIRQVGSVAELDTLQGYLRGSTGDADGDGHVSEGDTILVKLGPATAADFLAALLQLCAANREEPAMNALGMLVECIGTLDLQDHGEWPKFRSVLPARGTDTQHYAALVCAIIRAKQQAKAVGGTLMIKDARELAVKLAKEQHMDVTLVSTGIGLLIIGVVVANPRMITKMVGLLLATCMPAEEGGNGTFEHRPTTSLGTPISSPSAPALGSSRPTTAANNHFEQYQTLQARQHQLHAAVCSLLVAGAGRCESESVQLLGQGIEHLAALLFPAVPLPSDRKTAAKEAVVAEAKITKVVHLVLKISSGDMKAVGRTLASTASQAAQGHARALVRRGALMLAERLRVPNEMVAVVLALGEGDLKSALPLVMSIMVKHGTQQAKQVAGKGGMSEADVEQGLQMLIQLACSISDTAAHKSSCGILSALLTEAKPKKLLLLARTVGVSEPVLKMAVAAMNRDMPVCAEVVLPFVLDGVCGDDIARGQELEMAVLSIFRLFTGTSKDRVAEEQPQIMSLDGPAPSLKLSSEEQCLLLAARAVHVPPTFAKLALALHRRDLATTSTIAIGLIARAFGRDAISGDSSKVKQAVVAIPAVFRLLSSRGSVSAISADDCESMAGLFGLDSEAVHMCR